MSTHGVDLVAQWRSDADVSNPAGLLFVGGEYAEADIVGESSTNIKTIGGCGTACSGSSSHPCC